MWSHKTESHRRQVVARPVLTVPAKYQINILKSLGGVDFTKYALLPISQYVHWTKIGSVQNAVNLSKNNYLALNSFMHIYNMFITYLPSIK